MADAEQQVMTFTLDLTMPGQVFFAYRTHGRLYYIMGTEKLLKGDKLAVLDSSDVKVQTFFTVGDLIPADYVGSVQNKSVNIDDLRLGIILYTSASSICHGSSVVAYSTRWASSMRSAKPAPFGMAPVFKASYVSIFHQKNSATIAVSPSVSKRLRTNLEIT